MHRVTAPSSLGPSVRSVPGGAVGRHPPRRVARVAAGRLALPSGSASAALAALALVLAAGTSPASAQRTLVFTPTYQQSVATLDPGSTDPVVGQQTFHAWGVMLGLERPGRWWQPHLWFQQYDVAQPCAAPSTPGDCGNDGWALSVGPGLQVIRTPTVTGMILLQVAFESGGSGLGGGAGFHLGVHLEVIRPSMFGRYHAIRGAHFATVGVGLVFRLPLERR